MTKNQKVAVKAMFFGFTLTLTLAVLAAISPALLMFTVFSAFFSFIGYLALGGTP